MGDEFLWESAKFALRDVSGALVNPDRELDRLVRDFSAEWRLSPKQTSLVGMAVAGHHRKEVAHRLACSLKTVEGYWKRIYEKTNSQSQAEVVSKFIHHAFETDTLPFVEELLLRSEPC
jgi:DNA-binding CsgD family transcriptional regulator